MITLVLTNRNRDIRIVKNCLDSLQNQTDSDFEWFLVDYGSEEEYLEGLKKLNSSYSSLQFMSCPTQGQLWNKSRAINIVLKKTETPYFFVADIDMIFHPHFVEMLKEKATLSKAIYFQVGFLAEEESKKNVPFDEYEVAFLSNHEATGMTLYPTQKLKAIGGYDEFYHGWGAEDTDVHFRLKNDNFEVFFDQSNILMKHQWHPKVYRSKNSSAPFHSKLEKINHQYINQVVKLKRVLANQNFESGLEPDSNKYLQLKTEAESILITSEKNEVEALFLGTFSSLPSGFYHFKFINHPLHKDLKNKIKVQLGKKALSFYTLDEINDYLLSTIIAQYRNAPYILKYNKEEQALNLKIIF